MKLRDSSVLKYLNQSIPCLKKKKEIELEAHFDNCSKISKLEFKTNS